jgi:LmbE family N-acetylglucosaminyl deacetylase
MRLRASARRNDRLVCRGGAASFPVSVREDGFDLPDASEARGRTAFLALDVDVTPLGRLQEPALVMHCGGVTHGQYFERGAHGLRHLNLSSVLSDVSDAALTNIGLRGHSLRWRSEGLLTLFAPPALSDGTLLILAPHPDDAEIAAFGLYASRPSAAWVVTITAGEWGAMNLSAVLPSRAQDVYWKAFLRVWDSVTVPQLGGVSDERCLNLAYPDRELASMARQATLPHRLSCEPELARSTLRARNRDRAFQQGSADCTWADLVSELRLVIEKTKPTTVVCPHPILDGHLDHVFTTVAVEQALRQSAHKVTTFLLYVVHAAGTPSYPFGSADAVVSLPPWADGEWVADSMYSHCLSPALQRAKYFAVEASHDVRTYGDGASRTGRQLLGAMRREISAFARGAAVDPMSFFLRRAPRPNELYYVVSADSLSELTRRRLSQGPAWQSKE